MPDGDETQDAKAKELEKPSKIMACPWEGPEADYDPLLTLYKGNLAAGANPRVIAVETEAGAWRQPALDVPDLESAVFFLEGFVSVLSICKFGSRGKPPLERDYSKLPSLCVCVCACKRVSCCVQRAPGAGACSEMFAADVLPVSHVLPLFAA